MEKIALLGAPNAGKTSLFNWLTGRRQKVVNYPGSTVDMAVGRLLENLGGDFAIVDTPGSYSLFPMAQDEKITCDTLFSHTLGVKRVVIVIDATQVGRYIPFIEQVKECGFSAVVALTMVDVVRKTGGEVNLNALTEQLGLQVIAIDGRLGGGVQDLVKAIRNLKNGVVRAPTAPWSEEQYHRKLVVGDQLQAKTVRGEKNPAAVTERVDRIALHPFLGFVVFVAVMTTLFVSIYYLAQPFMDAIDTGFGALGELARSWLGSGLVADLAADGVVAGIGSVLVFVPQIFILFLGITLLEDSGYLARAAAIIDKPFSKIGLNGKAFVPLLSGFACAVPATMAARNINSPRERWIATFIIPFMTCSARLPVYALLLGFLFANSPGVAGLLLALLYIGGVLVGALAAGILNLFLKKSSDSFFLMELPIYRRPRLYSALMSAVRRTKAYIYKTGPIILVLSLGIWVLTTFPNFQEPDAAKRLHESYAARAGRVIEPIFVPMGADWRVGVGLISAFAAREVFVSSLAVVMNVTEADSQDEEGLTKGLVAQMRGASWPDGSPLFTVASVAALIVFFMVALQCLSTVSVAMREMNSAKFALVQLVTMNIAAYALAVLTYQLFR